jgi:hypothetical protein
MKIESQTFDGKKVIYEESFWTGKKRVIIDNVTLNKIGKKEYMLGDTRYILSGNFLFGAKLESLEEEIVLVKKLNAIEWILVALPLFLVLIGGALGGALGAVAACSNAAVVRSIKNVILKIIACIAIAGIAYIVWFVIAMMLIS